MARTSVQNSIDEDRAPEEALVFKPDCSIGAYRAEIGRKDGELKSGSD